MDNIFYNASHTDTAPPHAFHRPAHAFKGITRAPAGPKSQPDTCERAPAAHAIAVHAARHAMRSALQEASPNRARALLGLPSLPVAQPGAPALLHTRDAAAPALEPTSEGFEAPSAKQA